MGGTEGINQSWGSNDRATDRKSFPFWHFTLSCNSLETTRSFWGQSETPELHYYWCGSLNANDPGMRRKVHQWGLVTTPPTLTDSVLVLLLLLLPPPILYIAILHQSVVSRQTTKQTIQLSLDHQPSKSTASFSFSRLATPFIISIRMVFFISLKTFSSVSFQIMPDFRTDNLFCTVNAHESHIT